MDAITITLNVDIEALKEIGIDPATSEGKAEIRSFIIRAVNDAAIGEGMAYEGREQVLVRALIGEEAII